MDVKRKISVLAVLVALLMVIVVAGSLTVAASDSSHSSGGSSSAPQPMGGGIEITSYETVVNGASISHITEGTSFVMRLHILDSRLTSPVPIADPAIIQAKGKMNTASFRPASGEGIAYQLGGNFYGEMGFEYVLEFPVTYTGVGNTFSCDIYYDNDVNNIAPVTTASVSIHNCVETTSSSDSTGGSSSTVVRGTGFALKEASYGQGAVLAGERFTLEITMMATSGGTNIENVSATLLPEKEFTIAEGSSTVYYGTARPEQDILLSFDLQAASDAKDGSYKVTLEMKGVNSVSGDPVGIEVDFSIPIAQPDRLVINNFTPPDYISAGVQDNTGQMTVNLINMGKSDLSNVMVEVVGDSIYTLEGTTYLGSMPSNAQNAADFTVMCDEPGHYEAEVVVRYENARGEQNELHEPFVVEVGEPMIDMPISSFYDDSQNQGKLPLWGWLLIILGGAAVAVVVIVLVVRRRRKAADAALEDEDDEDL
ncbi:hypothetical protein LJC49_03480 [Ruminococcaceae bacterium OttesenSCG-928-I18]|nr:hypothetical protein [Ruminococcaceae bacterium OttesenSCG-928-I18]